MYASNGERESLDWSDLEEEVEDFKRKYIYRTIIETELKDMLYPDDQKRSSPIEFHLSLMCNCHSLLAV